MDFRVVSHGYNFVEIFVLIEFRKECVKLKENLNFIRLRLGPELSVSSEDLLNHFTIEVARIYIDWANIFIYQIVYLLVKM